MTGRQTGDGPVGSDEEKRQQRLVMWRALHDKHYERFVKLAYWRLWDRVAAEKAADRTFDQLYRRLPEIMSDKTPHALMRKILDDQVKPLIRDLERRGRKARHADLEVDDGDHVMWSVPRDWVQDTCSKLDLDRQMSTVELTLQQRKCVVLYYLCDRNYKEAAELLGVVASTVKYHIEQAIEQLRAQQLTDQPIHRPAVQPVRPASDEHLRGTTG